jgi:predicted aspartyl protease
MKLFALCFLFAAVAAAECPAGMTAVPLKTIDGFLTVPVSVNGESPHNFVLDTGAQITTLSPEIAHGTPRIQETAVIGVNGNVAGYGTVVNSIAVGNAALTRHPVIVVPLGNFTGEAHKVHGILGKDFLSNFNVLIQHGKTACIQ